MGGNAIKTVPVQRIPKTDYDIIKQDIVDKFKHVLIIDFLYDLPNKQDFGDIDVLYRVINPSNNIRLLLTEILNPKEIVKNGPVLSFSYQYKDYYCQIDFIHSTNMEMSKFYLSYSDTGAIIGRLSSFCGFKFGDGGIWVNVNGKLLNKYDNSNIFVDTQPYGKIMLTDNVETICEFMNLNYSQWRNGFKNHIEIFEWICASYMYSYKIYTSLDYAHRKRAKLRKFYCDFIEYISIHHPQTPDIIDYTEIAIERFGIQDKVIRLLNEQKILIDRHTKFNGNFFIEHGYEGKNIGKCMKYIKDTINEKYDNFENWLDNNSIDNIHSTYENLIVKFEEQNK